MYSVPDFCNGVQINIEINGIERESMRRRAFRQTSTYLNYTIDWSFKLKLPVKRLTLRTVIANFKLVQMLAY